MISPLIPPTARSIIDLAAEECEVAPRDLFRPRLTPSARAARDLAIQRLAHEKIDGQWRYPIRQLCQWFKLSRPRVNAIRAKDPRGLTRANRSPAS